MISLLRNTVMRRYVYMHYTDTHTVHTLCSTDVRTHTRYKRSTHTQIMDTHTHTHMKDWDAL